MTFKLSMGFYINIAPLNFASTSLEFFNAQDLKASLPEESGIYPFSIEGYIGIIDIRNSTVLSYTVFANKAKDRAATLIRADLIKRINNPEINVQPDDKLLFNVQSGEIIGSLQFNNIFSKIFRNTPVNFRDSDGDETLVWASGKFWRTTPAYANMLSLKIRVAKEIFESPEISDLLLGLFLEIEEFKLTEYARIDEIVDVCKPNKANFDLYQKSYGKLLDSFIR